MSENRTTTQSTATPSAVATTPATASPESPRILGHHRREKIVQQVRQFGAVRVRELTEQFGVSEMTIRRDIDNLDAANRLQRVHGGATVLRSTDEPGFSVKSGRQLTEKQRIASVAASLVEAGSAIGITAGTTTFQMVEHLTRIPNLTVVTNSLPVASALHRVMRSDLTLLLTGGTPTPSDALVGPVADKSLENLHLDHVFMGIHGMGEDTGFTTPNLPEAQTNAAFIDAAVRLIVVADSTKWGTTGLCTIAPLAAADVLITDTSLVSEAQTLLSANVGELLSV